MRTLRRDNAAILSIAGSKLSEVLAEPSVLSGKLLSDELFRVFGGSCLESRSEATVMFSDFGYSTVTTRVLVHLTYLQKYSF